MSAHLQWLLTPLYPVDTYPRLTDPVPISGGTNFEYDTEFYSKNPTPNIHLYHPCLYRNTKKVSHMDKYLLTTLTTICFKDSICCPV